MLLSPIHNLSPSHTLFSDGLNSSFLFILNRLSWVFIILSISTSTSFLYFGYAFSTESCSTELFFNSSSLPASDAASNTPSFTILSSMLDVLTIPSYCRDFFCAPFFLADTPLDSSSFFFFLCFLRLSLFPSLFHCKLVFQLLEHLSGLEPP
ncbi:hypothetical protein NEQG_00644 [Nematocida parisii ERTm3]|uniref:Uncharacterized protein n=1 Tax=Nematocida parisii (strain ERTm3) TaxID=935791 RepID=I3EHX8_NEMP3|nr:hypothetical protein NEQG_00644 [Nematocida parisii ERTm3]